MNLKQTLLTFFQYQGHQRLYTIYNNFIIYSLFYTIVYSLHFIHLSFTSLYVYDVSKPPMSIVVIKCAFRFCNIRSSVFQWIHSNRIFPIYDLHARFVHDGI